MVNSILSGIMQYTYWSTLKTLRNVQKQKQHYVCKLAVIMMKCHSYGFGRSIIDQIERAFLIGPKGREILYTTDKCT